ncbi:hypothetical protein TCE0_004r00291 [Talaromyces pinophilus]|uniref:Zn(2)-C6 fungal-type domain-containing protein n=1 Tax=Talaromyces pinophilus TaxID=128442 RepID=A0A0B8N296_TALPI|nr:hypothetical protein TCE0_004r00291 [Talaromyces pinophilus]
MESTDQNRQPNLSRRYACDRCRNHKLRCNRDFMSPRGPCQRCRKARVNCTMGTSTAAPLGHPRLTQDKQLPHPMPPTELRSSASSNSTGTDSQQRIFHDPLGSSHHHHHRSSVDDPSDTDSGRPDSSHRSPTAWLDFISLDAGQPPSTSTLSTHQISAPLGAHTYHLDSNAGISDPLGDSWWNDSELEVGRQSLGLSSEPNGGTEVAAPSLGEPRLFQSAAVRGTSTAPSVSWMLTDDVLGHDLMSTEIVGDSASNNPPSSAEIRENTIQEMTELSGTLMKGMNFIMTCRTASSFLFTPSDKTVTGYMFKMLNETENSHNPVGQMLHGAESFLNIIKRLNQTPCQSSSVPVSASLFPIRSSVPRDGEHATNEFSGHGGAAGANASQKNGNGTSPMVRSAERWARYQEHLGQLPQQTVATSQHSSGHTRSSSSSLVDMGKPDVPSTLVILNCYVCLLKTHEVVFSVIHHVLQSSPDTSSAAELPLTIRDLQIDGFLLQNHGSMQIRILIQVSTYLLNSVKKALGETLTNMIRFIAVEISYIP